MFVRLRVVCAADGAPPLLILNAEVELVSRDGARRLPLDVFINGVRSTLQLLQNRVDALPLVATDTEGIRPDITGALTRQYLT